MFSLREIPATLTSLVLSFNFWTLTTTEGPKQIDSVESTAERKSDMEAVLHGSANTAEPKTKDFNTCKDSPIGEHAFLTPINEINDFINVSFREDEYE